MTAIKILLVDDSAVFRRLAKQAIEQELGMSPVDFIERDNGKEALFWVRMNPPADIILMDWNMPEMNGLECIREIRAHGNLTPIMMITIDREKSDIVDVIRAGANNYLLKPIDAATLCKKIRQALQISQAKN
ncbi:MAG: response regulator [Vampirovibrionales bacterium]|nr:response regulator [Vampirovibrionales bacterium]